MKLNESTKNIPNCSPEISVTGTSLPAGATGQWSIDGVGTLSTYTEPALTVSDLTNGDLTLYWKVTKGTCYATQSFHYLNNIVNVKLPEDMIVCNQTSASITAENYNSSGSYTWVYHGVTSTTTTNTFNATNLNEGANRVYVRLQGTTGGNSCVKEDEMTIYKLISDPKVNKEYVCDESQEQSVIKLTANSLAGYPAGTTGVWTANGEATITDPNANETSALITGTGNVSFTWTVTSPTGNCSVENTTPIVQKLKLDLSANEVCTTTPIADIATGGSATISVSASSLPTGFVGVWSTESAAVNGGSITIDSPSNTSTKVSKLAAGVSSFKYTVQAKQNDGTLSECKNSVTVNVVNVTASANASTPSVCSKSEYVTLNGNDPAPGTGKWSKAEGDFSDDDIADPNNSVAVVTHLGQSYSGKNKVKWTVSYTTLGGKKCEIEDVVTIENDSVFADAGPDIEVCGEGEEFNAVTATLNAKKLDDNFTPKAEGWWTKPAGASANFDGNVSTESVKVTGLAFGGTTFTWHTRRKKAGTENDYCEWSDDVVVYNSKVTIADAGKDQFLCNENNTTTLSGNAAAQGEGIWELVKGVAEFNSDKNSNRSVAVYVTNIINNGKNYRVRAEVRTDETGKKDVSYSAYWLKATPDLVP
ncbi:MAG: hypothetical protein IIU11_07555, partial [Bacteroidales bacterium]|nr:hypothetical protein [Bacteroidales bacterium]